MSEFAMENGWSMIHGWLTSSTWFRSTAKRWNSPYPKSQETWTKPLFCGTPRAKPREPRRISSQNVVFRDHTPPISIHFSSWGWFILYMSIAFLGKLGMVFGWLEPAEKPEQAAPWLQSTSWEVSPYRCRRRANSACYSWATYRWDNHI